MPAEPSLSLFPNSVWERIAAKLCFASHKVDEMYPQSRLRGDLPMLYWKQSFQAVRSQTEFGNEGW
jgi:hypothetical protein